jgi:outer membrane protein assembly factor BamB
MHRLCALALLLLAPVVCPSAAHARSDGGDLLWEDELDAVETAAADGRIAAVGTVADAHGGRTPILRVYDADRGRPLWQDTVDAHSVVIDDDRVVVVGDGFVRAYDTRRGRPVWGDAPPFVVTQLYRDGDTTLATAVSEDGTAIRIRVYDSRRGRVLVEDQTLPLQGVTAFSAGKMFVATSIAVLDPASGALTFPCHVSAYSVESGEQLWATTQPFLVPNTRFCTPIAVTADRKRAVLAGIGGFGDQFLAQGYDARTGEFLWQHQPVIGTPTINAAIAVDVERGMAFVGGWTLNPFTGSSLNQDFVVFGLDADSGAPRWEARTPGPDCATPPPCRLHAKLVVADSGSVYAAGFQGESGQSIAGTGFLRSYESGSGRLRWQADDVDVEAIVATSGTVVVVTPGDGGPDEAILRAYDGK